MVNLNKYGITSGDEHTHEEMIYSLALIYNVLHGAIANYLQKYDLTPGKFNILMSIKNHAPKEGIPQVEISKHLIVTKSNMTKLLDKLEDDGLVIRNLIPTDRRVKLIQITEKAEKLLDDLWGGYNETLKAHVSHLNKEKQGKSSRLLQEWLGGLI